MGANPYVLHVARLRRNPGNRRHEALVLPASGIEELTPANPADPAVPEGAELAVDLVLEAIPGGVTVVGTVSAPWRGTCARCTVPVEGTVEAQVSERYLEDGYRQRHPDDEEAYPLDGDKLDLHPLVRDAVLFELPMAPLCTPDCKGLCPQCGADRNAEECGCGAPRDPRWANLDVLR